MNLIEYTYNLVRQIPPGRVSSYGAVAEALGDSRAARSVGYMMNQNPDADTMPCFKIVHSDGRLGGFGLGEHDKIHRLQDDGVQVKDGGIVDFEKVFFNEFTTEYPLKKLRQKQVETCKEISLENSVDDIISVAGVDVAYPHEAFDQACGAIVVMDFASGDLLESHVDFASSLFPYIPTYLFYREFPVLKTIFQKLSSCPSVVLFDGHGILHPFGCGLASQAGVALDIASIGVAKSALGGKVRKDQVFINNEARGTVGYFSKQAKHPVYISPGHKISLEKSREIVQQVSTHKIPEPLRQAHLLATKSLRKQRHGST